MSNLSAMHEFAETRIALLGSAVVQATTASVVIGAGGVSVVMRHTSLGYDALFHVLVVTNSVCLAALVAVVLHLRRNFVPAMGSIRAAQLARRESFSDDCREARTS